MLGNFHDDVINIECETSSADLYVVDAEGIYIENIAMHSYLESDVIDAINAKYGTIFTHLTMLKVTGIAIGDACPNWDAYEKIEIQSQKIAVKSKETAVGDLFIIGTLSGENFEIITNGNQSCVVRSNGVSEGYLGPPASASDYIKGLLQGVGLTATSISEQVVSWEPGSTVPNWSEYTQYT